MPRDLFPREHDREIIDAFLRGRAHKESKEADVILRDHRLIYFRNGVANMAPALAWFDTAGSLTVSILNGSMFSPSARAINYMATRLGMPEVSIHYETEDTTDPDGKFERVFKFFMEDKPVLPGTPVVLCGPMTVQAFRATNR